MTVYCILVMDRHCDPGIEIFADEDSAVKRARGLAKKYCRHRDDYEESQLADWIFYARYSCEGDSVRVLEREIQGSES